MNTVTPAQIRSWAAEQGFEVGHRGRLSHEVIVQFWKAHPRTLREIAEITGVPVSKRGPVGTKAIEAIIHS